MSDETQPELLNRKPKWLKPVLEGIIVVFILIIIAFLSQPMVIRSATKSPKTEAINNAKQIGLALFSFEDEYGSYPNESTLPLVNENNPDRVYDCSGKSSNAAFRQLMKAGITESEQMFYAKIKGSVKPDGNISPGEALKKGEVGFAYISSQASAGNPSRLLLLSPLIPGTTKFDPEPYDGMAMALHIDNSVSAYKIGKDGHIYDKDGLDILSPKHPMWNGIAPTIHYPE